MSATLVSLEGAASLYYIQKEANIFFLFAVFVKRTEQNKWLRPLSRESSRDT